MPQTKVHKISRVVLAPSSNVIIGMVIVSAPFTALGIYGFFLPHGALLGTILVGIGSYLWLNVGTIRIVLENGTIEFRRFWRTVWLATASEVEAKDGRGGDFSILPALLLVDMSNGETRGVILKTQFTKNSIDTVRRYVEAVN